MQLPSVLIQSVGTISARARLSRVSMINDCSANGRLLIACISLYLSAAQSCQQVKPFDSRHRLSLGKQKARISSRRDDDVSRTGNGSGRRMQIKQVVGGGGGGGGGGVLIVFGCSSVGRRSLSAPLRQPRNRRRPAKLLRSPFAKQTRKQAAEQTHSPASHLVIALL